jgi:DNA-binding response OmpR family regulator
MVLIVEDEFLIQTMVEESLREAGFETALAPSAEEAVLSVKIPAKIIMVANKHPKFLDESGALADRVLISKHPSRR